ncbi:hypothetical protein G0Q06_06390 [Puniceicoccales bacterium CK1056]|uniref:Uncharacterized protein n=1 Tax=Oceanipulchritudo coccoides TaxID=2706888 RepID=A0A6B2M1I2_9BACT|nr:hypothetical protein [Oceanipulchritudo coccoides]NDV62069.1 hypothetical protein [Oceanipulchritudo coccoides]
MKRYIPTLKNYSLLLFGLTFSAVMAQAATMVISEDGGTIDYADTNAWSTFTPGDGKLPAGRIPTAGDITTINANGTVNLASDVSSDVPDLINLANQFPGEATAGTLNINSGGNLVLGRLTISGNGSAGVLNIQGGSVSANGTNAPITFGSDAGILNITSGSFNDLFTGSRTVFTGTGGNCLGVINLSGGSLNSTGSVDNEILRLRAAQINISGGTLNMTGGQVVPGNSGAPGNPVTTFTVTGNDATILTDRLNVSVSPTTFVFNFDADGISPFVSSAFMNLGTATVVVDGTNYTGGSGSFPIFTATNIATLPAGDISLVGWDGYDVSIESEIVGEATVSINVVVVGEGQDPTWAGFLIGTDGWVDTGSLLGWINVSTDDFVYANSLGKYLYLPESQVGDSGAWTYVYD